MSIAVNLDVTGGGGGAAKSQSFGINYGIPGALADGDYAISNDFPFAATFTQTSSKSGSGTATATFKINGTPMGGTANAISTTRQRQTQASANVIAAGDVLTVTISANSSCNDAAFDLLFTRSLS